MTQVILEQPPINNRREPAGFAAATAQDEFSGGTAFGSLPPNKSSEPLPSAVRRFQPAGPPRSRTVIRSSTGWRAINFAELVQYRELLWILAARDIKVRYKQTALGVMWAILQPVLTMVVFTVV